MSDLHGEGWGDPELQPDIAGGDTDGQQAVLGPESDQLHATYDQVVQPEAALEEPAEAVDPADPAQSDELQTHDGEVPGGRDGEEARVEPVVRPGEPVVTSLLPPAGAIEKDKDVAQRPPTAIAPQTGAAALAIGHEMVVNPIQPDSQRWGEPAQELVEKTGQQPATKPAADTHTQPAELASEPESHGEEIGENGDEEEARVEPVAPETPELPDSAVIGAAVDYPADAEGPAVMQPAADVKPEPPEPADRRDAEEELAQPGSSEVDATDTDTADGVADSSGSGKSGSGDGVTTFDDGGKMPPEPFGDAEEAHIIEIANQEIAARIALRARVFADGGPRGVFARILRIDGDKALEALADYRALLDAVPDSRKPGKAPSQAYLAGGENDPEFVNAILGVMGFSDDMYTENLPAALYAIQVVSAAYPEKRLSELAEMSWPWAGTELSEAYYDENEALDITGRQWGAVLHKIESGGMHISPEEFAAATERLAAAVALDPAQVNTFDDLSPLDKVGEDIVTILLANGLNDPTARYVKEGFAGPMVRNIVYTRANNDQEIEIACSAYDVICTRYEVSPDGDRLGSGPIGYTAQAHMPFPSDARLYATNNVVGETVRPLYYATPEELQLYASIVRDFARDISNHLLAPEDLSDTRPTPDTLNLQLHEADGEPTAPVDLAPDTPPDLIRALSFMPARESRPRVTAEDRAHIVRLYQNYMYHALLDKTSDAESVESLGGDLTRTLDFTRQFADGKNRLAFSLSHRHDGQPTIQIERYETQGYSTALRERFIYSVDYRDGVVKRVDFGDADDPNYEYSQSYGPVGFAELVGLVGLIASARHSDTE